MKQKQEYLKGDWFQLLQNDFKFIGIEMNEEDIQSMSKANYKKKIKYLVQKAAFNYFIEEKSKHSKLKNLEYTSLQIQPYLTSKSINNKEAELLYNLRSNCYRAKYNFKKMYKNNTLCGLGCSNTEDQNPIFKICQPIQTKLKVTNNIDYMSIYGEVSLQIEAVKVLIEVEKIRNFLTENLLTGGDSCQDPARDSNFTFAV